MAPDYLLVMPKPPMDIVEPKVFTVRAAREYRLALKHQVTRWRRSRCEVIYRFNEILWLTTKGQQQIELDDGCILLLRERWVDYPDSN